MISGKLLLSSVIIQHSAHNIISENSISHILPLLWNIHIGASADPRYLRAKIGSGHAIYESCKICTPMCAKACLGMCGAKFVGWWKTKPGAGEGVSASCTERRVSAHETQIWGQNSWQSWPPAGWASWGGAHKQAGTRMRWFFTLQGPAGLASTFYCKFLPALPCT